MTTFTRPHFDRDLLRRALRAVLMLLLLLLALALYLIGTGLNQVLATPAAVAGPEATPQLMFFWGVGCPDCERAKPFVREVEDDYREVEFSWYEVKLDPDGRRKFIKKVRELRIPKPSVPTFVCGDDYVVGFTEGKTEKKVRHLLDECSQDVTPR